MCFDVEGDWYLLDTCNYRCEYCFFSPEMLGRKLRVHATPLEWSRAFSATGLTWLIHMTGGEPTFYPDFVELCGALTESHFISFNSNLSQPSIRSFAERIDPERVSFINAGLHDAERERKRGFPQFLAHLELLKKHRFPVFVSVVATPAVLASMEGIVEALRPAGLVPVPKLLRGMFEGKPFPDSYSALDMRRFRDAAQRARDAYGPPARGSRPTIDPFTDDDFLHGVPDYTGRTCSAGHRFVSIDQDGSVHRCSQKTKLGNLLDGSFRQSRGAKACDTNYCFYFCEKYSRPRLKDRWFGNWSR